MDRYRPWCEQEGSPEDRLSSLSEDILISIQSFLPIKQRVALSAVCSRFRGLLPSIPRVDTFRLDVGSSSGGVDVHREITFPRALIRQCRVAFCGDAELPNHLKQMLVEGLVESGVQDLILETSDKELFNLSGGGNGGLFGVKSLSSLSLDRIRMSDYFYRRPLPPFGCALLTSLKMEFCLLPYDFLPDLLASCPFLETLQVICCYVLEHGMGGLSVHSASIKHLVLLRVITGVDAIDINGPKLESLAVDIVDELRIDAPKVQNASFHPTFITPEDLPVAFVYLPGAAFRRHSAWLMLNSGKPPNISAAAENGIYKFISPENKKDFNLKDRSSAMKLTRLLKKDSNIKFDICADSTHIDSTTEDDRLLYDSTELEQID